MIKVSLLLFLLIAGVSKTISQDNPNYKEQKFKIIYTDSLIITGDKFMIQNSDYLEVDNKVLTRFSDYVINYRNGYIRLDTGLFRKYSLDTNRIYDLTIRYDLFPYTLKDEYSIYDLKIDRDTLTGDTIQIATSNRDFMENLFEGTDLQKSGSLFRGFTLGTNRDISLNSGFRLQLNGKLTKDIEITAALTDENTPIQPEGNTQKLQELDKVFIELKSNNVSATIGDIDISLSNSEFFNFQRKIQGAKGYGDFGITNFLISGAVSRGKFNTNTFNGLDGVQGPYRLNGKENEINIVVLSGTERVYLNGILMTRGEQADYTIDYGLGQIVFTTKRLITAASRIIVDFEYSDRKYSRTLLTGNNGYKLFDKKLTVNLSYMSEIDNQDKTIDFSLSDNDKQILSQAGADKLKAVRSGVLFVGKDSLNHPLGTYIKADTLIGVQTYTIYKFKPGDSLAVYNITFSYVGAGKGDYKNVSTYQYDFAGINGGSYAPVVFLPMPVAYQLAGLSFDYAFNRTRDAYIKFESAYSLFNQNKFSVIDAKTGGVAFNGEAGFIKNNFDFFGFKFNNFLLKYKERYIDSKFTTLDRINNAEFNRNFDLFDSTNASENYRDAILSVSPSKILKIDGNFAQLIRGDFFNSLRLIGTFEFNNATWTDFKKEIPIVKYSFENISSENKNFGRDGSWFKQNAFIGYKKFLGNEINQRYFEISGIFTQENRKSRQKIQTAGDSLLFESFAFIEAAPRFSINNIFDFNFFSEFNYRKDDAPSLGIMENLSNSFTQRYGLTYGGLQWLFADFDFSIRNRKYSDLGHLQGNEDNKTVLVNSKIRFNPFSGAIQADALYSITSERTAKVQKAFVLVPIGQGNYIYLGDLNNNGIQDENEFQLTNFDGNYVRLNLPTDQYFPTVDLKTSLRVNLKPAKYFSINATNILSEIYNNFSTETFIRIDEKSKDPDTDNIYFLHTGTFLNDSNTLLGNQLFQQDVYFFENNPGYSLRLRYQQTKAYNQYTGGNERSLQIQRSARIRLGLTQDLTSQFELISKTDRNITPAVSIRNRNISGLNFNSDITYRPVPNIESGLQLNFANSEDKFPILITIAKINQQILRFIYSFATLGRIRLEIERDEILLNSAETNFPYELTMGKPGGKSYYWRASLDYSISKNIQATLNYDGRSEGRKQVIHTGRAQVTAFF